MDSHDTYLGMPLVIGQDRKKVFQYVVEMVAKRIQGWKARILSKAGKDVLLGIVAQAVPNYLMSLFLIPVDTCKDIESLMNDFFLDNSSRDKGGLHWFR